MPQLRNMQDINEQEIIYQRLARNGLSEPFSEPLACVRSLAGIQSQFQQYAEVSIMNRCDYSLTMNDLAELYNLHEIINLWGQRHTLHMYVKEDWDCICDLYEPIITTKDQVYKLHKKDFDSINGQIRKELSRNKTLLKAKIIELIRKRMKDRSCEVNYFDYAFIRLNCLRGVFCGIPEKPGIKSFICRSKTHDSPWKSCSKRASASLDSLLLRYFEFYGPATLADFCHWSGLPQGMIKKRLHELRDGLASFCYGDREYFSVGERKLETDPNAVFLLGKFDPLFVSYRHKDWIVPPELEKRIWQKAAWVEAVIIDGAKIAGTWRHTLKDNKMSIQVFPFGKIKLSSRMKIQTKTERLADFWEKQLDAVVFEK